MIKIAKFGGSSVADAEHFKKIKAIVDADPARRFVVVSACGRRFKGDTKVTDLLYLVNAHVKYHVSCEELLEDIGQRYFDIADELELTYPIREEFAAFAEHYGCTVYPTRVRHPKDKALVENAVKLLYRSVYADIEGLVFHSLESLNAAISESLSAFNGRRMSGRPQSRREQFEQIESDCLRPLPAIRHQMKERRSATVMRNGYVTFRLHHYSVPKEYIGKRVEIVYDADTLEIYHGLRLVTTHQRDDTPYSYTTKDAHGLPGRHGSYEKDLEQIYERAGQTDNVLLLYLRKVAELKKYPPAAFRSCRGIMALEKTFGLERLVAASACATQLRLYGYQEIRRILERGDDADFLSKDDIDDEVPVTSIHKNIRGAAYFAQLKHLNRDNNGNK